MTAGSTCPPPAVDSCKTRRTELGYPREAWIWETPCRLAAGSAASRKATCGPRARDCITAQGCRPPHALGKPTNVGIRRMQTWRNKEGFGFDPPVCREECPN